MNKEEYTVNIGNLKISGPAEDIHELANIYGLAVCEYGHKIIDEIHGDHCDHFIAALKINQKKIKNIEKLIIDAIKDSDYYKEFSSQKECLIDDILKEIEHDKR